ncbi:MAG TPA: type I glyceraldehyde-3-phosphate dehydrogenase, partial [Flavobacteriaceae bacterium]|nr:type I glyceraldehyde-3-phosphate dehydrogenase [Flavobacteriaceae bacterium]
MKAPITIGINGFGRIGRTLFRLLLNHPTIKVVAINDIANGNTMAHLLKYDSIHGVLPNDVSFSEGQLHVDEKKFRYSSEATLDNLDWKGVDIVIEATGKFKTKALLQKHIENGAKKVILSVPPLEDDIKTIVLGVNEGILEASDSIISNASCTTNNA